MPIASDSVSSRPSFGAAVPARAGGDSLSVASDGLREARILIVDDEEMNLRVVRRMLARAGFECVETLGDARQVAARVAEWRPALVLLDLHMPHHDGFTVVEQMRAAHGRHDPAILLFTGDGIAELRDRAASAGVSGFVTKPFDMRDALHLIRVTLLAQQQTATAA